MGNGLATGIAIEAGRVWAAELAAGDAGIAVRRVAAEPLPPDVFADGVLADPETAAKVAGRLLKRHGFARRRVYAALGGRRSIGRVIDVSASSAGEAEQVLQDRIARYAIYDQAEVVWKAAPLPGDPGLVRSFLAAAAVAEEVQGLLSPLQRAGLNVVSFEPHALCTLRALAVSEPEATPETDAPDAEDDAPEAPPVVFVSPSGDATDFLIVRGARPLLLRTLEADPGDANLDARLEAVATEVRRSLEYCRARFAEAVPSVRLCGTCAGKGPSADLAERLQAALPDVDVTAPATPPAVVPADGTDPADLCGARAAIGAALGALGRNSVVPILNLMPAEWPELQRVRRQLVGYLASVVGAVGLMVLGSVAVRSATGDVARRAEGALVEMHKNSQVVLDAARLKQQTASAVAKVRFWKEVRHRLTPFDWVAGVRAASAAAPEQVRILQLSYRRGVLRVTGEARTPDDVHEFVRRLASLHILEDASIERLDSYALQGNRYPRYTIACRFLAETLPEPAAPAEGGTP